MPSGVSSPYNNPAVPPQMASPTNSAYGAYGSAAKQQGVDYDSIMNRYRDLLDSVGNGQGQVDLNYNYTVPTYQTTSDYRNSINNLADLSKTGGYSSADIANIRERGISPIRSIYGNAQSNLDRQRRLQGGYSPNYTAATSKMAREMSSQISDEVTNVNAQIAQNVAQNKLAASVPYAGTAASEQANRNDFALKAAEMGNQFGLSKLNQQIQNYEFPIQAKLSGLSGMTNLFGTTPGFTNMLGANAGNLAALQGNINNQNQNRGLQLIGQYMGA